MARDSKLYADKPKTMRFKWKEASVTQFRNRLNAIRSMSEENNLPYHKKRVLAYLGLGAAWHHNAWKKMIDEAIDCTHRKKKIELIENELVYCELLLTDKIYSDHRLLGKVLEIEMQAEVARDMSQPVQIEFSKDFDKLVVIENDTE